MAVVETRGCVPSGCAALYFIVSKAESQWNAGGRYDS